MRGSIARATLKVTRVTGTGLASLASVVPPDGSVVTHINASDVLRVRVMDQPGVLQNLQSIEDSIADTVADKGLLIGVACDGTNLDLYNTSAGAITWAYVYWSLA